MFQFGKALTIEERLAELGTTRSSSDDNAAFHLDQWVAKKGAKNKADLESSKSTLTIESARLAAEAPQAPRKQPWMIRVSEWLPGGDARAGSASYDQSLANHLSGEPDLLALLLERPQQYYAKALTSQLCEIVGSGSVDILASHQYFQNYLEHFARILEGALTLEIEIIELQQPGTSMEKFAELVKSEAWASYFWCEYPVAVRLVDTILTHAVETFVETVVSLVEAWDSMGEVNSEIAHYSSLIGLDLHGDPHQNSSVISLDFAANDGSSRRIFARKRSASTHHAVSQLMEQLKQSNPDLLLLSTDSVYRNSWYWSRSAEPDRIEPEGRTFEYFRSFGHTLAFHYVLGTTDLHGDNVIHTKDGPLFFDLETVFDRRATKDKSSEDLGFMLYSVLSTGAVPSMLHSSLERDVSALTMADDQTQIPLHTDDIAELEAAFAYALNYFSEHKGIFLEWANAFDIDSLTTRRIVRATQKYGEALEDSCHPDYLQDQFGRDLFFEELWVDNRAAAAAQEELRQEKQQLANGFVPLYRTQGRKVFSEVGQVDMTLPESPTDLLNSQLDRATNQAEIQQKILKRSLASRNHEDTLRTAKELSSLAFANGTGADSDGLFSSMIGLAADQILQEQDQLTWLNTDLYAVDQWLCEFADFSLGQGNAGLLAGLACGALTNDSAPEARQLRRQVRDSLSTGLPADLVVSNAGYYDGLAGIAYALAIDSAVKTELSEANVNQGQRVGDEISFERLAAATKEALLRCDEVDFQTGYAGIIVGASATYQMTGVHEFAEVVELAADRFISSLVDRLIPHDDGPPLCGLSHGQSGAVLAMVRAIEALGPQQRFLDVLERALAYESVQFEHFGYWPDYRAGYSANEQLLNALCHGSVGIGKVLKVVADHNLPVIQQFGNREHLNAACELSTRKPLTSPEVCHGGYSVLDFLDVDMGTTSGLSVAAMVGVTEATDSANPTFLNGIAGALWAKARVESAASGDDGSASAEMHMVPDLCIGEPLLFSGERHEPQ